MPTVRFPSIGAIRPRLGAVLALLAAFAAEPGFAAEAPTSDSVRIIVAYHSDTGHTERMARAAAEGARQAVGVAVVLKPVADVARSELETADGIILGSPTHWANMAAPVKSFIDDWPDMVDRVGGAFATGGAPTGGKEYVIASLVLAMLNHGMVVVGPVYEEDGFRYGAAGASAVTGPRDPGVSAAELDEARSLGRRVAEAAARRVRATVETYSLFGDPLRPEARSSETRARFERQLEEARSEYERDPHDADAIIWLGRRTAYLGRYREAMAIFTEGIRKHPSDARFYRHRGHRHITLREFDRAVADLTRAAELVRGVPDEVEPDGLPNEYGIPTSTLQTNIWYHLGLAYYLRAELDDALAAFLECLRRSDNDDMRVATTDWLYMTYRRLGRDQEAARLLEPIHADMRILENHAYHRRLLMYKGELAPDELLADTGDSLQMATQGYGVGNWYLYNAQPERARDIFRRVLSFGNWPAFGHIAAEADLYRLEAGLELPSSPGT